MAYTCCENVKITVVLSDLKIQNDGLADVFCDNKTAIQISTNPIFHDRTIHIEIDYHLIRDYLTKVVIVTKFVPEFQLVDVFTRILKSLMLNIK